MSKRAVEETYAVWATAWGAMGAVAVNARIVRIVLPHYQRRDLEQLLAWEHQKASADDAPFERLIELSRDYFNGKPTDFAEIDVKTPGAFAGDVLAACREIPYGQTRSYSRLAMEMGREEAAHALAAALGKNPVPLVIPCHRVIYNDGRVGGFSADGGPALKARMLEMEAKGAK